MHVGVLLVTLLSGKLVALDLHDGSFKWEFETGKPIFTSPVICEDNILFGCVDNCVYSLSTVGRLLWRYSSSGHVFSSPVCKYFDGSWFVLFGSNDGFIYCMSNQGKLLWKLKHRSAIVASPAIIDSLRHGESVNKKRKLVKYYIDRNGGCSNMLNVREHNRKIRIKSVASHCSAHNSEESNCSANSVLKKTVDNLKIKYKQGIDAEKTDQIVSGNFKFSGVSIEDQEQPQLDRAQDQSNENGTTHYDDSLRHCYQTSVFCVDIKGKIGVVDLLSGEPVPIQYSLIQCDGEVFSSPVVIDDRIVFGCRDDNVYCLRVG